MDVRCDGAQRRLVAVMLAQRFRGLGQSGRHWAGRSARGALAKLVVRPASACGAASRVGGASPTWRSSGWRVDPGPARRTGESTGRRTSILQQCEASGWQPTVVLAYDGHDREFPFYRYKRLAGLWWDNESEFKLGASVVTYLTRRAGERSRTATLTTRSSWRMTSGGGHTTTPGRQPRESLSYESSATPRTVTATLPEQLFPASDSSATASTQAP